MKTQVYLIVNDSGSVYTRKTQPDLKANEVSMLLSLDLPDRLFEKPMLSGEIVVSDDDITPTVINPEIKQDIQDMILEHSGVEVNLNIIHPSDA